MRYHLHIPAPAAPLSDCLCALWGPTRGPAIVGLHGSPPTGEVGPCGIEATGAAWLQIADAIDSGATLALPTIAIGPMTTDPRSRKESRTILGEDAVRHLSPEDLTALASDIRAKLAPPEDPALCPADHCPISDDGLCVRCHERPEDAVKAAERDRPDRPAGRPPGVPTSAPTYDHNGDPNGRAMPIVDQPPLRLTKETPMSTCFLHVSEPADDYDDDSPTILTPPGDRWCSLWAAREPGGPRLPCHPSIEGTATEWLLIAGAIEAGAPRAFDRVAFAPQAGGGEFWSPRNSTGDRDHVRLTTAELVELAAAVRATLAPPIDTTGAPTSAPEPGSLEARLLDLWTRGGAHSSALIPVYLLGASEARASAQPPAVADQPAQPAGLALVRALADQRRNPVIVVQSYDAALLRTRETDEWGVGSSSDRAWEYDREGASWGLTKAEAMRRYADLTLHGFCATCVALYDSGVDECPTCHPPAEATPDAPAEPTTPPAIPPDLRALLEELVAAEDEWHRPTASDDDLGSIEVKRDAIHDDIIAWTRTHAGGGR